MDVFYLVLFLVTALTVSGTEYVPVLVWSTQTTEDSHPTIPALSRLTTNEFTDYLLNRVKVENPVILVFMEENLSVEDFSWKDLNGNGAFPMLNNITKMADDIAFLPSVHEPYLGIKQLKNHGYVWRYYEKEGFETLKDGKNAIFEVKLDEPYYLEDRPDLLKKHDEKMTKIYSEVLDYRANVMVIYSGRHTSWSDAELGRFKREAESNTTIVIHDEKNIVRMTATLPIVYWKKGTPDETVQIAKIIGEPTIKEDKEEKLILTVRFAVNEESQSRISVDFKFTNTGDGWWALDSAEMNSFIMKPSVKIEAPNNHSYFCNPEVSFINESVSLTFENFQAQPRVGLGNSFGPVIHCIPFFSIAILSGLLVVFLLSVVLAWGITMIMDINTNDRFDDPKGKTITVTASD